MKLTASACGMFCVKETDEISKALNSFIFNLRVNNAPFEFEPEDNLHVTWFFTPSTIPFPLKLEINTFIRSIVPEGINDLQMLGIDFFGEDKDTLVIVYDSLTLRSLNDIVVDFLSSRGVEFNYQNYVPHLTLGKINRRNLFIPDLNDFELVFDKVKLSYG